MTEYRTTDQPAGREPRTAPTDREPAGPATSPAPEADAEVGARYGVRPGMSRGRKIALGVVGVALLAGVAGYIGWNESHPQVQATVISYTTDGDAVTVRFEVDKPADESLECTLTAVDVHGATVGTVNVPVAAGRSKEDLQSVVNTTAAPNSVSVTNCIKA